MLHLIQDLTDRFFDLLSQDPVRPHIPHADRVGNNKDIFVLQAEDGTARAVTCVSYQDTVPGSENELFKSLDAPTVAVFYTIWSYAPGAGRELILNAVQHIKEHNPTITTFVTLSPKTEMARRFHTKNGALVFRQNDETVNYKYADL